MKKSVIALAVSSLALAGVAQAASQENTFYVGANAGWASFHDGIKDITDPAEKTGVYKNSVTYGVFGGYQILNNGTTGLAAELAYDDFGTLKLRDSQNKKDGETTAKMTNHGTTLSVKGSVKVVEGLDLYGRVGAALVRSDYKNDKSNTQRNTWEREQHSLHVSPVFAAGVEYNLPSLPQLAARLEYKWVNNVGRYEDANGKREDFRPDIGSVNLGVSYRFGQETAPQIITKNFTFSSDVLFAFAKADLKPAAAQALDSAKTEIDALGNVTSVQVNGYTDRIGSEKSNVRLSQRRAETVANYLLSKGMNRDVLSAAGYGEANPVTGKTCDKVKGRKAVIACLAPDRRVEIQVQGTKQVSM
ncbi:Outer membrane protein P5 precursor [Phocoenobacter uteri]|uniref:Outer membrane protein A n=1 Tax=Phocoenobacter uteri TaxID=146806 RepID=A0A379CCS3_9PAST|nr:porin OmpA [Phocoenobacter uteri]MDG6881861.1 hypothetical protein [Phocoenobacter uteri]SUB59899.1 Outer membrane protein P5 precursor [Phocoenobacter uteri]